MDEDGIPEHPYRADLNQGQKRRYQGDNRVDGHRLSGEEFRDKGAKSAHYQPTEKHEGDGNLISRELGEKLSHGNDLNSDRGYPRPDDGYDDESGEVHEIDE